MKANILTICFLGLVIINVVLLLQNYNLKQYQIPEAQIQAVDSSFVVTIEGVDLDLRGLYTSPSLGALYAPTDEDDSPIVASLTLSIFLSSNSSCPYRTNEVEVYKRLLPVFRKRNQNMVAVVNRPDSAEMYDSLISWELDSPLIVRGMNPESFDFTFAQLGFSSMNMPFKVLYDSTFTAIYMRGSNPTPESQHDFEVAVLRLSELVAEGKL